MKNQKNNKRGLKAPSVKKGGQMFKKRFFFLFILVTYSISNSAELRFGKGSFSVSSDIFGSSKEIKEDITVYSITEQHKNIFGNRLYYSYNLSFLSSEKERKVIDLYNTAYDPTPGYKPQMEYELKGFDGQIDLGFDVLNSGSSYLGFSAFLGISLPYIENYNTDSNNNNTLSALPDSKTEIKTYRVGGSVKGGYEIFPRINIFGFFSYGYQTGKVENEKWGIDGSVNGSYMTIGGGIKFYIFKEKKKILFLTLSPQLYVTAGYKYDRWELKDVKINNIALNLNKDDLVITDSYGFFGLGYSF